MQFSIVLTADSLQARREWRDTTEGMGKIINKQNNKMVNLECHTGQSYRHRPGMGVRSLGPSGQRQRRVCKFETS